MLQIHLKSNFQDGWPEEVLDQKSGGSISMVCQKQEYVGDIHYHTLRDTLPRILCIDHHSFIFVKHKRVGDTILYAPKNPILKICRKCKRRIRCNKKGIFNG